MTETPAPAPARLTAGQTVGWALAMFVIAVLVALFFLYDTAARPLFGMIPGTVLHG